MAAKKRKAGGGRRRAKGSGSVYPVKTRTGVAYCAALEIDGRIVRRRAADEPAAEAALRRLIALRDAGIRVGDAAQPLRDWLNVWYGVVRQAGRLKPRSLDDYRRMIESYIIPALGDVRLDALTGERIQAFVFAVRDDIRAHTRHDGATTATRCAVVLKMALGLAVRRRLLPASPYDGIELPAPRPRRVDPPTDGQVAAFLAAARDDKLVALWHIYALLGLRLGEGLGLRWEDYDAAAGTLRVAQQVQRRARRGETPGALMIGAPKSSAGHRVLPCPAVVAGLLDARRAAQLRTRVRRADVWQETGLIFTSNDGAALWPRHVQERWRALWRGAGLPDAIVLHDLRRAVATMLDEADATETIKAAILGHQTATMTQHYVTARIEAMRRALARVEDRVMRRVA